MSLALVKIMSDDLQQIMDWRMKPEVTKFMYTDPVLTLEGQQKWFDYIQKDQTTMHWLIMIDDVKIGLINLYDIDYKNKRCSWAYYIGDTSFRGRGIATTLECNIYDYVFDVLKLNKLCCEVFAFNEKVIAIHEKFGSVVEGKYTQHIYKDNQYYDVVHMAITKAKWSQTKSSYTYEKIIIEN
jgi:UDP-4-amino-4,6-dideoxy-N-acetyl-beta-L-altrosamine N-acetyltransferase